MHRLLVYQGSVHTGRQWFKATSTYLNLTNTFLTLHMHYSLIYSNITHKHSNTTHSITVHVNFRPPLRNSWQNPGIYSYNATIISMSWQLCCKYISCYNITLFSFTLYAFVLDDKRNININMTKINYICHN